MTPNDPYLCLFLKNGETSVKYLEMTIVHLSQK